MMPTAAMLACEPGVKAGDLSRLQRYLSRDEVRGPYIDWQLAAFRPYLGRRVLEIGCGTGGIIAQLGARELVCGIDVDPDLLEYARRRHLRRRECDFRCLDFAECPAAELEQLRQRRFDTIVCMNVLEHIRDDIGALQRMEQVLAPAGIVALLVPAHPALFGRYDLLEVHYRRYTKTCLRVILQHTSFRMLKMHYFNALGGLGWWVKYRLLRRGIHGPAQFRLMSRLSPVLRRVEAVVRPPFGLSLIAVLQRP